MHHKPRDKLGRDCSVKLTPEDVRLIRQITEEARDEIAEIRKRTAPSVLAEKFGVSTNTIDSIINYRTWKHVL